ncbi:MAG: hypothetical protein V4657_00875 [Pseudomonadota bacterium]
MTLLITRFPKTDADDPLVYRIIEGAWQNAGALSEFIPATDDATAMAVIAPEDVRCTWLALPDLEARQAVGVAKLRAAEQSLGLIHASAGLDFDDVVATATIAPDVMQHGLDRLALRGLNPDIVIPFALVLRPNSDGIFRAELDGMAVLKGAQIAIPDESVLRDICIGSAPIEQIDAETVRAMLLTASAAPLVNLREGMFAKRERTIWASATQRMWIRRILTSLLAVTMMLTIITLAKYWRATSAENETALAAAQKIDPSIQDIEQAESALVNALNQKGLVQGSFAPLSAGLWRSVKASPNVSVRELRFTPDGILSVVLAAPTADNINKTLLAIQQDGFRITATPRQDASGATLVDVTMRLP